MFTDYQMTVTPASEPGSKVKLKFGCRLKAGMMGILSFLLPPRCPWCRLLAPVPSEQGVCKACFAAIQWSPGEWRSNKVPAHCDSIHAVSIFQGVVRDAVHVLKYQRKPYVAESCAKVMIPVARGLPQPDAVLAVPLSAQRLRDRRYNQSEWLARHLACALQVPLVSGVVTRAHSELPQVGLGAEARWENVRDQFVITPTNAHSIADRHLLLIDDVVTTGATLQALARTLKKTGAKTVRALTLGQTV
jgi:ComF family protein